MKFSIASIVAVAALCSQVDAFSTPAFTSTHVAQRNVHSATAVQMRSLFEKDEVGSVETITLPPPSQVSEGQIRSLFYLWNNALATLDSRIVAKRYAKDPLLLPTVSDTPRGDFDSIKDYFDAFLKLKPQGTILEGKIKIGENWAQDAGIYEFTMGADGSKVKARYSFIYVYEDNQWKIAHHHSSVMPESGGRYIQEIDEDSVRNLFHLWNDALDTLDPQAVANRYSKNPVLLPTVSDAPRTDEAGLLDYFTNFLKLKPQGVILESFVSIGDNWCKDCGIYEFTLRETGAKVKARYSFVYVYEDAQWKISHHHSSVMPEESKGAEMADDDDVRALFSLWNDALATDDPETVAQRYAKDAVLLATVSDTPRTDHEGIKDYFVNFLKLKPQGKILESYVTKGPNWCKDAGVYEFTMGASGTVVKARYSFLYVYEDGEWKIKHHHSSVMPEGSKPVEISDDEVRGLFGLWNGALATLDSEKVTQRYASDAVLLPTVSDTPRTDHDSIKDYFDAFLKLEPQGEIIESFITKGTNWCKDVGIYEFTMGATGAVVRARYSFIYVFEDGEWKIKHHHSSAMPEAKNKQQPSDEEVRLLFYVWNNALATLDSDTVAKRYASKAVLLPTVSDIPRTDYAAIKDYFDNFLKLQPQGEIIESYVTQGDGWCKDVGIYEFTMGATGAVVRARYSFVYVYEEGEWKIMHHHSSAMPEASKGLTLTEDEARSLFYQWNDALETLDSDQVAKRYSKDAVLLPTVSDTPRTDYDSIKDYFDTFLLNEPKGEIIESYVQCGENWAKDVGIYEFTMGVDGTKVRARYSFVYRPEDGEWKIAHHHSSIMPESLLNADDEDDMEEIEEELVLSAKKVNGKASSKK